MTITASIRNLGISDAKNALAACGTITACDEIGEDALQAVRSILKEAGDSRADLASLGYRAEGRELMAAYAAGWDEVADV